MSNHRRGFINARQCIKWIKKPGRRESQRAGGLESVNEEDADNGEATPAPNRYSDVALSACGEIDADSASKSLPSAHVTHNMRANGFARIGVFDSLGAQIIVMVDEREHWAVNRSRIDGFRCWMIRSK
ncbi:uncharacterized protein CDV56_102285 [Aspergillus thermomutatus]|uniref:Uncharacterized protein n=1 Tax=Aspergillus thermomutatus TaxID=41047 RepID=A0A397GQV2_ASPTH|nr:uncharacterized protein CDV56_102285 [Aspergillus thermomutatus]RHZ52719.1 hypothetical protein CDV56_102285 [Aspergillus thermomutatus]